MLISPIQEIIEDLKQGRMVVLMDDEDRENEGDLVIASEHTSAEDVNFMAKYGRGLICLTLTEDRCRQLQLPLMVSDSQYRNSTNFTVSIEAAEGVTTGISAADRAMTVQAAIAKDARPSDIVMPGHIFPLKAKRGGVLARAGHTEAGVDLARLAGLEPSSMICEIMNEDGTMARLPELKEFAKQHNLKIGTIADLIRYRLETESTVQRVHESTMSTSYGDLRVVVYHDDVSDAMHLALVKGTVEQDKPILVRVHVQSSLLDLFTEAHRAGSWTLQAALGRIACEEAGIVVILHHEESPGQLLRHMESICKKQNDKASGHSRIREELRTYGLGSQILHDLGVRHMRVMGHSVKAPGMSGFDLDITEYIEGPDPKLSVVNNKKQIK